MPPKKRARVATSKPKQSPARRSTRRNAQDDDKLADVYQEMLAELPDDEKRDERPTKRRKTTSEIEDLRIATKTIASPEITPDETHREGQKSIPDKDLRHQTRRPFESSSAINNLPASRDALSHQTQVVYQDSLTDSDDSEEFEDVDVRSSAPTEAAPSSTTAILERASKPVTISFNSSVRSTPRRRQITKADRLHRLAVHKWHYLCLLLHMANVNKWCNDSEVQASLKKIISRKLISRLHHDGTQAERKYAFDNSMIEISRIWQSTFKCTEPGSRRARWRNLSSLDLAEEMENAPEPIDFEDLREHAKAGKRYGSRDLGAQLFCALCRALAVDTRLVCSLQVLSFAMATDKSTTRSEDFIEAGEQDFGTSQSVYGQTSRIDSERPVWWVEVLNPAIDQWIAVDPRSLGSYNQPRTRIEPPASDPLNSMSYVVAFEENGSAKDVTKRYASAYNAKTRRTRIENTRDGEMWMARVMSVFAKSTPEPRDQIEDAELNRRVALEGMPKSVQDFKDHPVYVLERHLRSTEIIEPKKQCGRLKVGKDKVEIVYRREHVHACRTADGWYRKGRNVREGMQPLRHVPKRRGLNSGDDEDEPLAALYAEYQTEIYVPPEVENGRVPRNVFGNLDVYVPTMIPMGGVHIRHPFAINAAKALGIDHAEAVTGFKFKGRQGTAVLDGIIVALEHLAVVTEAISTIEEEADEETNDAIDAIIGRLWAAMLRSLRVRQMVQEEYGDETTRKVSIFDEHEEEDKFDLEDAEVSDGDDLTYEDDDGGGFTVEVGEATTKSRAEEAAQLSSLRDNKPVTLPPPVIRQKIVAILSPHKPQSSKPALPQEESYNELFDDEPDSIQHPEFDVTRAQEWNGMTQDDEVGGGGFITSPQDSRGSWDSGLASNMQDAVAGGWYTDYMMSPSDLPIRDYVSEITPSPDPISTPDYPNMAPFSRENKAITTETGNDEEDGYAVAQAEHRSEIAETESLPSHDPDEDDAEPEWVAEAFDEL